MGQLKSLLFKTNSIHVPEYTAKLVLNCQNVHGECPIWDDIKNELYWVDMGTNKFWRYNPLTNNSYSYLLPEQPGSFALCEHSHMNDNYALFAFPTGPSFINLSTFKYIGNKLFNFEANLPTIMTDGRVDRNGKFIVGGYVTLKGNDRLQKLTNIYRINQDLSHDIIINNISATNSICFSLNGDTLFMTDSRFINKKKIMKYEYFSDNKLPINPSIYTQWNDDEKYYNNDNGYHCSIDGSIIDSDGYLWNAEFNGSKVVRYDKNGNINMIVRVPEPYVTCANFGGNNLDTLYITTSSIRMSNDEKRKYGTVGGLYSVKLPVKGVKENRFRGKPEMLQISENYP